MAKIALVFIAAFCFAQMSMSARIEKRDTADQAVEITTQSIFESFKGGVKNLFSDDNIKKVSDTLGDAWNKTKDGTKTAYTSVSGSVQKLLNKDESTTAAPASAPAA